MTSSDSFPDFIHFLFSSKPKLDCYFKVGNKAQGKPVRIGAVKLMLMAHSEVFRAQLEFSELKENKNKDVPIEDIHPETFKGMLRYVYGNDTTAEMCFDDADNMLYVAEKYMIKTLKDKLATRLMQLLNKDNICSLLNNPACYRHLELNSAITDILRYETDSILASTEFLLMSADNFLKILEQDGLAVPEIELWRAAIRWAKHKSNSEDGQLLRQQLSGLTQHLRPLTLSVVEYVEVLSSGVLEKDEVKAVSLYLLNGKREDELQELSDFSNETKARKVVKRKPDELSLANLDKNCNATGIKVYNFTVLTKTKTIELLPSVRWTSHCDSKTPKHWTHSVACTITITKVKNPNNVNSSEPPKVLTFREDVKLGVEMVTPPVVDGKNLTLQPDTLYTGQMEVNGQHKQHYSNTNGTGIYENDDLTLDLQNMSNTSSYTYIFPSSELQYRVVTTVK